MVELNIFKLACCEKSNFNKFFSILIHHFSKVQIGDQVWMSENLSVTTFRNGDPIPEARTNEEWNLANIKKEPAWCHYENDGTNSRKYGKLYNWYAVNDSRGLAPKGWHIPSDPEWHKLVRFLGQDASGVKMKSLSGWAENGKGDNASGFNGLPGGMRTENGWFDFVEKNGYWWTTSETNSDGAGVFMLKHDSYSAEMRLFLIKGRGLSVRCLRD